MLREQDQDRHPFLQRFVETVFRSSLFSDVGNDERSALHLA